MKLSKRLETVASFIDSDDNVIDVGCDHAYLDIYLALNQKNKTIIATDISKNVIKNAISNIKRFNLQDKIEVVCTDGIKNIKDSFDTIVVSGMGSTTILNILKTPNKAKKLVISSNNNWDEIRKKITKSGFYLSKEKLVYEKNKLYSIMLFIKEHKKTSKKELLVGSYSLDNKNLYNKYYDLLQNTYKKIPLKSLKRKYKYYLQIKYLNEYLGKENR